MCAAAAGGLGPEGRRPPPEGLQAAVALHSSSRFLPLEGQWWDMLVTFSDPGASWPVLHPANGRRGGGAQLRGWSSGSRE